MTATNSHKPLNILLVEDDDGDAKALERAFHKAGSTNQMARAIDGIEALEILRGNNGKTKPSSPVILLVDLNMPRMNGIEMVKALRQDEDLRHSVVFILTTSKRDEDKKAAYDLNVTGYITKGKVADDLENLVMLLDYYAVLVELP
jgi:CheY-like chemotaxis protein